MDKKCYSNTALLFVFCSSLFHATSVSGNDIIASRNGMEHAIKQHVDEIHELQEQMMKAFTGDTSEAKEIGASYDKINFAIDEHNEEKKITITITGLQANSLDATYEKNKINITTPQETITISEKDDSLLSVAVMKISKEKKEEKGSFMHQESASTSQFSKTIENQFDLQETTLEYNKEKKILTAIIPMQQMHKGKVIPIAVTQ